MAAPRLPPDRYRRSRRPEKQDLPDTDLSSLLLMDKNDRPTRHARGGSVDTAGRHPQSFNQRHHTAAAAASASASASASAAAASQALAPAHVSGQGFLTSSTNNCPSSSTSACAASSSTLAKRYRRRSLGSWDLPAMDFDHDPSLTLLPQPDFYSQPQPHPQPLSQPQTHSFHYQPDYHFQGYPNQFQSQFQSQPLPLQNYQSYPSQSYYRQPAGAGAAPPPPPQPIGPTIQERRSSRHSVQSSNYLPGYPAAQSHALSHGQQNPNHNAHSHHHHHPAPQRVSSPPTQSIHIPNRLSSATATRRDPMKDPKRDSTRDVAKDSKRDSNRDLNREMNRQSKRESISNQMQASNPPPPSPAAAAAAAPAPHAIPTPTSTPPPAHESSKKSRLRRAFSFGTASDLRAASASPSPSGIGENIYSSRQLPGRAATIDRVSISSTASSASVMIRKMGNGVRRSGRSLAGLFRGRRGKDKADREINVDFLTKPAPGKTDLKPAVSMVTVEGENKTAASTSDDTASTALHNAVAEKPRRASATPSPTDQDDTRKQIVGGDRERADALSALGLPPQPQPPLSLPPKGILKHKNKSSAGSNTSSTSATSTSSTSSESNDPFPPPQLDINFCFETPPSSAPSTPRNVDATTTNAAAAPAYFLEGGPSSGDAATPATPAPVKKLNWNEKPVYHVTWCKGDYDRRGEIPTTARLTPLLAAQIREELNTFKMEMEVHEASKIYTHFF